MIYCKKDVTAIILAGGRSTRVNGKNKALLLLQNKPLISHVMERISTQLNLIIISANSDLEWFRQTNYPVVEDDNQLFLGPLSGLKSCAPHITTPIVMTLPCDAPFIPANLVSRMCDALNKAPTKLQVVDNGRQQNLFMMFHRDLLQSIDGYLASGQRSVYGWISQHDVNVVDFRDSADCFTNINTLDALKAVHQKMHKE